MLMLMLTRTLCVHWPLCEVKGRTTLMFTLSLTLFEKDLNKAPRLTENNATQGIKNKQFF